MTETVLPLEAILLQLLFLLVAIALEARVFYQKLYVTRQTSVAYSTSLNLLSIGVGWLSFFALINLLPLELKLQIISYIFFDHLFGARPENFNTLIVCLGIAIFFFTFLIKFISLEFLETWQRENLKKGRAKQNLESLEAGQSLPHQATAVLLANAYSHTAILLLLFLRFFQLNSLS